MRVAAVIALLMLSACRRDAVCSTLACRCDAGNGAACGEAARSLFETPAQANAARVLYAQGCQLGDAPSCLGAAGDRSIAPSEREALKARALTLLPAACEKGDALSCEQLFTLDAGTDAGERARDLLAMGCDAGMQPACHRLGSALLDGRLGLSSPVEAEALLQRACTAGIAGACAELGMAYNFGKGLTQDPVKARQLMQRAGMLSRDSGAP